MLKYLIQFELSTAQQVICLKKLYKRKASLIWKLSKNKSLLNSFVQFLMQNKRQYKGHLFKYKINRIYTKPPNTKRNWFNILVQLNKQVVTHLTNLVFHVSSSCSPLMSHLIQPLLIQVSYWEWVLIYKNDLRGHKVTRKQKHFHTVK